jgi:hypothetical protein
MVQNLDKRYKKGVLLLNRTPFYKNNIQLFNNHHFELSFYLHPFLLTEWAKLDY